ncbi:hypothetical protein ACPA9J_03905 [Pseudomonas aeruginosa]
MSVIQREREKCWPSTNRRAVCRSRCSGKLAGKSKDQINRELKAGSAAVYQLGQPRAAHARPALVTLKHKLAQVLMNQCPACGSVGPVPDADPRPHPDLGDRAAIDIMDTRKFGHGRAGHRGHQQQPNRPGPDSSVQGIPEGLASAFNGC